MSWTWLSSSTRTHSSMLYGRKLPGKILGCNLSLCVWEVNVPCVCVCRSTARSMDQLVFVSSWSHIVGAKLQIKVDVGSLVSVKLGLISTVKSRCLNFVDRTSSSETNVFNCVGLIVFSCLSSRLEVSSWKVVVLMVLVFVRTSTTLPVCQRSQRVTWPGSYRCVWLQTAALGLFCRRTWCKRVLNIFWFCMCSLLSYCDPRPPQILPSQWTRSCSRYTEAPRG